MKLIRKPMSDFEIADKYDCNMTAMENIITYENRITELVKEFYIDTGRPADSTTQKARRRCVNETIKNPVVSTRKGEFPLFSMWCRSVKAEYLNDMLNLEKKNRGENPTVLPKAERKEFNIDYKEKYCFMVNRDIKNQTIIKQLKNDLKNVKQENKNLIKQTNMSAQQVIQEPVEVPQIICKEIVNDIIDSIPEPKIEEPKIEQSDNNFDLDEYFKDIEIVAPNINILKTIVDECLSHYDEKNIEEDILDDILHRVNEIIEDKNHDCEVKGLEDEANKWSDVYEEFQDYDNELFTRYF